MWYGPPMVRGTIPHVKSSTCKETMVVWKHAHDFQGFAFPVETSQSVRSPSNSSTQTDGTGSGSRCFPVRTALTTDSGENAVDALRSCLKRGREQSMVNHFLAIILRCR